MESDSSTLEDFSQEDWCNQVLDSAFQEGDMETGECVGREWADSSERDAETVGLSSGVCFFSSLEEIQMPKNRALQIQIELSEQIQ